jgi:hypothetical protein
MALTAVEVDHGRMTELVRLPFCCDPSEVLEVMERGGGLMARLASSRAATSGRT